MKVHQVHPTKTPLALSERGPADGLMADGLCATHQTARNAGAVRRVVLLAALLSSTPSVHQSISKQGLEAENEGLGLSESDGPGWTQPGCPRSPGRMVPAWCPRRPITPRAPENLYESGMSRPGNAGRTPDRIISHDAPCLGSTQNRPWDAASRDIPGLNAPGENRGRKPKVISDLQTQSDADPVTGRGGGAQKNPELVIGASPAGALRHPSSTDRLVSDH